MAKLKAEEIQSIAKERQAKRMAADLRRADKDDQADYRHMIEDRRREREDDSRRDAASNRIDGKTFPVGTRDEGFLHPVVGKLAEVVQTLNYMKGQPYGDGVPLRQMTKPATQSQIDKSVAETRSRVRGDAWHGDAVEYAYAGHGKDKTRRHLDDDDFGPDEKFTPAKGQTPAPLKKK